VQRANRSIPAASRVVVALASCASPACTCLALALAHRHPSKSILSPKPSAAQRASLFTPHSHSPPWHPSSYPLHAPSTQPDAVFVCDTRRTIHQTIHSRVCSPIIRRKRLHRIAHPPPTTAPRRRNHLAAPTNPPEPRVCMSGAHFSAPAASLRSRSFHRSRVLDLAAHRRSSVTRRCPR
jgi:hypothetical protein